MKNQSQINQNETSPFDDENDQRNEEFPGLEQPNLYHFNINNETEEQAVKRLDAEIRVCMRQYTITSIRDRAMELPDVTYMMKLYMVGQELRARELSIKERQLALRERAMALKEAQAGKAGKASAQKYGEDGEGIAGPESASTTTETPATSSSRTPSRPNKPSEIKSPILASELKAANQIIDSKNAPKEEPNPDMISENGTGIPIDAIVAAGYEHSLEPLNGKGKKAR